MAGTSRLFPPPTGALAITARRDQWGEWTLSVTVGLDTPDGIDWQPSDTYTELTRAECADVVQAVASTFGAGRDFSY